MLSDDVLAVVGTFLDAREVLVVSGVCSAWYSLFRRYTVVQCASRSTDVASLRASLAETGARLTGNASEPVRRLYVAPMVPFARSDIPANVYSRLYDLSGRALQSVTALASWHCASVFELGVNGWMLDSGWFKPLLLALDAAHTPTLRTLRLTLYGHRRGSPTPVPPVEFVRLLGAGLRGRGGLEAVHLRLVNFSDAQATRMLLDLLWAGVDRLSLSVRLQSVYEPDGLDAPDLGRCIAKARGRHPDGPSCSDLTVNLHRYDLGFVPAVAQVAALERLDVAFECGGTTDCPWHRYTPRTRAGFCNLVILRLRMTAVGVTPCDLRNLCDWVDALPRLVEFRCHARRNPLCDRAFDGPRTDAPAAAAALRRWYVAVTAHPRLSAGTPARTVERIRRRYPELEECHLDVEEDDTTTTAVGVKTPTDTRTDRQRLIRSMRDSWARALDDR